MGPDLPAVEVKRPAVVLMPNTAVRKVKANALTSDGRKRKYEEPSTHSTQLIQSSKTTSDGSGKTQREKRAGTEHRLCSDVEHEFPFAFRYGGNALQLTVRENTNSSFFGSREGPEITYVFQFLQRGEIMVGSAEVSTKYRPRLMNFRFDVTEKTERGIAELALRAIIWFVKLQCPQASQFDYDVFGQNDRHPSCTKMHLKDFLKSVDLFQSTHQSAELLQVSSVAPREKIVVFLGDRINGRIIQDPE